MSHTLTLELNDEIYATVRRRAEEAGASPVDLVIRALERYCAGRPAETAQKAAESKEPFTGLLGSVRYASEEDLLAPIEDPWTAET